MGGTVIVGATVGGYLAPTCSCSTSRAGAHRHRRCCCCSSWSAWASVGFLDDYLKIRHRRSLGLNKTAKLVGQLVVGVAFAVLAINFPNSGDVTPASTTVSYVRDIAAAGARARSAS